MHTLPPPRSETEVVDVYFEDVLQVCSTSAKTVCCPLEIQDQQVAPKAVLPSSFPTCFLIYIMQLTCLASSATVMVLEILSSYVWNSSYKTTRSYVCSLDKNYNYHLGGRNSVDLPSQILNFAR